jgi:hypothetical protein
MRIAREPARPRRSIVGVPSLAAAAAAAVLLLAWAPHAGAQSGVQVTPDARLTLISKDVGDQRWAISYEPSSGAVTGNVFFPGGGEPVFVFCERTSDDGNPGDGDGEIGFSCSGADRCAMAPCAPEQWSFIAEVALPESFFLPPDGGSTDDAVPTSDGALFAYLQSGRYRSFAAESGVHPSAGPHGVGVRTYVNAPLESSFAAGASSHPVGAAAVKELYAGDGTTLTGWAVEVKTQPDSAGGQGWYWYEVFSTTDGSRPISGPGHPVCTGCHSEGIDYVRIPYPLQ